MFVLCLLLGIMVTEMKAQNMNDTMRQLKIEELEAKLNPQNGQTSNLSKDRRAIIEITEGHELYRDPKTLNFQLTFDPTMKNSNRPTPIDATPLTGERYEKVKELLSSKKTGQ